VAEIGAKIADRLLGCPRSEQPFDGLNVANV
jgi:hypothetical protein